ncbi:MAG: hypothetical protein M1839_005884 [Geoglossum umbratile]|nr:MAG: hypothetical protein M1839_005884 [Geoglossum umbratile]
MAAGGESDRGEDLDSVGLRVYEAYYKPAASIGFSIPITEMFAGPTLWRGIVYALVMVVAKLFTGIWLLRFTIVLPRAIETVSRKVRIPIKRFDSGNPSGVMSPNKNALGGKSGDASTPVARATDSSVNFERAAAPLPNIPLNPRASKTSNPRSFYPSAILGIAMVARGEIGFLIASVAESQGIFHTGNEEMENGNSSLYLQVTWAIVICTILGPVIVGILVKRVRALDEKREGSVTGGDCGTSVLGVWGIDARQDVTR